MPFIFARAQHDGLVAASTNLQVGEWVLAFLGDLYVVTSRVRVHAPFKQVAGKVEQHAGVETRLGKLRAWREGGGSAQADLAAAAPGACTAYKPDAENGLLVFGIPLGKKAFVDAHAQERMRREQKLQHRLGDMTDLQCRWVLLFQSAVPRANHMLHIPPPSLSRGYGVEHDNAL